MFNTSNTLSDSASVIEFVNEELGLALEEALPALLQAVLTLAHDSVDSDLDEVLDEAASFLADGGVEG